MIIAVFMIAKPLLRFGLRRKQDKNSSEIPHRLSIFPNREK